MRNISFAMTTEQVRARRKTVTRRLGWKNLMPGETLCAVVKSQGLKKGEKVEKIGPIRVVDVRRQFLDRLIHGDPIYGLQECAKEGFDLSHPMGTPEGFVKEFCSHNGCKPDDWVTRIEFEYL